MKKWLVNLLLLSSIILFAACSSDDKQEADVQGSSIEITDDEIVDDKEIVALVNGAEVLGNKYNIIYPQIKMYATQMEKDVELDAIKERTVDALIDQELIYQGAEKEGIIVTDEEVEEAFAKIKEENEDALNSLLKQFHLTEQGFKDQLMFEETMEQFVALKIDVDVSDEEVEQYYDEAKEQSEQIPEYEEIKEQLKAQLLKQKTEEELEAIVLEMKEKAKIEKKI